MMDDRNITNAIDILKKRLEQAEKYEQLQDVLYALDIDYKIYIVPWAGLPDRYNLCEGFDAVLELIDNKDGRVLYRIETRR